MQWFRGPGVSEQVSVAGKVMMGHEMVKWGNISSCWVKESTIDQVILGQIKLWWIRGHGGSGKVVVGYKSVMLGQERSQRTGVGSWWVINPSLSGQARSRRVRNIL